MRSSKGRTVPPHQQGLFESSAPTPEPDICANRHGGADTSVAADARVQKAKDRELIYRLVDQAGLWGITLDELSVRLQRTPNTISGRLTELRVAGRITGNGLTRPTRTGSAARVYVTTASTETEAHNEAEGGAI